MLAAFQAMKNVKGIVVSFNINFHAKCKGEARAVLEIDPKLIKDDTKGNSTWENKINVFDPKGTLVADMSVLWKLEFKNDGKTPR